MPNDRHFRNTDVFDPESAARHTGSPHLIAIPDRQGRIAKADNIIAWCERYRATAQD